MGGYDFTPGSLSEKTPTRESQYGLGRYGFPRRLLLSCASFPRFPSPLAPIGARFPRPQPDPTERSLVEVRSEEIVRQN